ncbi:DUF6891 domain-containing protein [Yinghuangia sp. YIM S09857]|uniref:DUF6891 domain-containing protein n=1 Tax=Yinghuangia sp. YIM S09857 TaxID=3436929 RepID=UPI003F53DB55
MPDDETTVEGAAHAVHTVHGGSPRDGSGPGAGGLEGPDGWIPLPGAALDPADRAYLLDALTVQVRGGFREDDLILAELDDLVMSALDVDDAALARLVAELVPYARELLRRERAAEESLEGATANDLIDRAFAELRAERIVALQNAGLTISDCWSDAEEEAGVLADEIRDAEEEASWGDGDAAAERDGGAEDGKGDFGDEGGSRWGGVRGAVFYHGQDLARAVRGEGLYLGFGAFAEDGEDAADMAVRSLAVARTAVDVLARHGVPVEWDGTVEQRLFVPPFNWRRRRWTRPPAN